MSTNQTALITGASGGIGMEFAKLLAGKGYNLVLVARSEDKLLDLKNHLEREQKIKINVVALDLSVSDSAQELFEQLQKQQIRVDVLINNAGFGEYGKFTELAWKRQHEMIELNVTTLTHLTHLFVPQMLERKNGRVLNVASTAAFQAGPYMGIYFATKAFVLSFSEALATELEGTGVTVTSLCPGPTDSNFKVAANMGRSSLFNSPLKIPSSQEVAEFGYRAMERGETVAVHGAINNLMVASTRFVPRSLLRKITVQIVGKPN